MIYAQLFWNFLMIGSFSFGGGYGMVSLVRDTVLGYGWMTSEEFTNFIAVAESTPGPVAVNMATFVGAAQGGFWGSLAATLGVVLPSFVIVLLIAAVLKNLMKYAGVQAFLSGVRPCVAAMVLATAITMAAQRFGGAFRSGGTFDVRSAALLLILVGIHVLCKRLRGRAPSPIWMIVISAALGIVFWGL